LARVASAYGVELAELSRLNPGVTGRLAEGARIRLPEDRPAAVPSAAAAVPAFHLVVKGETLASLARKYGLEAADLKAWNRLQTSRLSPGQRLRLSPPDGDLIPSPRRGNMDVPKGP
jgi:hypothetical protein